MSFADYLRQPIPAALFAAGVTIVYIQLTNRMSNKGKLPNHVFIKPAFLIGILVYFIVQMGQAQSEPILLKTTPF
jgi:hypothetical protein